MLKLLNVRSGVAVIPEYPYATKTSTGRCLPKSPCLATVTSRHVSWSPAVGVLESQYGRVAQYVNPVSKFVIALIIAVYLYRLITMKGGL
jgi:hypothetical protein